MADDPRFICKRTVVSTKEVKPGKICPLSVLDHSMELNRIRIVIYYNYLKKFSDGEVTIKMRESLAELLTSFPMVTGRLKRSPEGQWTIKCNDAGVRMVEATAKGSVEEWLERVDRERELQLASWEDMFHNPYFWSTFYVQVRGFGTNFLSQNYNVGLLHSVAPIIYESVIKTFSSIYIIQGYKMDGKNRN